LKEVDNDHIYNYLKLVFLILLLWEATTYDTATPTRKQKTYVVTASKSNNIVEEWSVLEFEIPYYFGQGR